MIELLTNYKFTLDTIEQAAAKVISLNQHLKVFLMDGQMGAGKTTLIKEICKTLGSTDNFSSPTFSIINEYNYPNGKIFHFDLYRIKNMAELMDLGFDEYVYSGQYCFIEWPELAEEFLKEGFVKIKLVTKGNIRYLSAT
ncbi:MAG: tRNA (adenosine(37)-N6)-threonylcarbamoyltransferase complex ATPase subunit type 1 TsaE [Bacteroidetes bacterium]|nr:tRNA (adenosine(37)-N6)-threonylcarbamoyltransferase complex ATPase subunit type 1 TsaE [Bacteroidota bacterium]